MSSEAAQSSSRAFNAGVLVSYVRHWKCANGCGMTKKTDIPEPHAPLHQCYLLRGAWVPFIEEGEKAHQVINRREDYAGTDLLTRDGDGKPVMSIQTIHEDGREDCTIFAPCSVRSYAEANDA